MEKKMNKEKPSFHKKWDDNGNKANVEMEWIKNNINVDSGEFFSDILNSDLVERLDRPVQACMVVLIVSFESQC